MSLLQYVSVVRACKGRQPQRPHLPSHLLPICPCCHTLSHGCWAAVSLAWLTPARPPFLLVAAKAPAALGAAQPPPLPCVLDLAAAPAPAPLPEISLPSAVSGFQKSGASGPNAPGLPLRACHYVTGKPRFSNHATKFSAGRRCFGAGCAPWDSAMACWPQCIQGMCTREAGRGAAAIESC